MQRKGLLFNELLRYPELSEALLPNGQAIVASIAGYPSRLRTTGSILSISFPFNMEAKQT